MIPQNINTKDSLGISCGLKGGVNGMLVCLFSYACVPIFFLCHAYSSIIAFILQLL